MRKNDLPSRLAAAERARLQNASSTRQAGYPWGPEWREPPRQFHGRPEHSSSLCLVDRGYRTKGQEGRTLIVHRGKDGDRMLDGAGERETP